MKHIDNIELEDEIRYHVDLGKFFGFLPCCIGEFVGEMREMGGFPMVMERRNAELRSRDYGMVPCSECAKKLDAGTMHRDELIRDRICSKPFPQQDHTQLQEYLKKLKHR